MNKMTNDAHRDWHGGVGNYWMRKQQGERGSCADGDETHFIIDIDMTVQQDGSVSYEFKK